MPQFTLHRTKGCYLSPLGYKLQDVCNLLLCLWGSTGLIAGGGGGGGADSKRRAGLLAPQGVASAGQAPNVSVTVGLGMLTSWRGVGDAGVACSGGCACPPETFRLNVTQQARASAPGRSLNRLPPLLGCISHVQCASALCGRVAGVHTGQMQEYSRTSCSAAMPKSKADLHEVVWPHRDGSCSKRYPIWAR